MHQVTVARRLGYEIKQQEGALAEVVEHARYSQYSATLTAMRQSCFDDVGLAQLRCLDKLRYLRDLEN